MDDLGDFDDMIVTPNTKKKARKGAADSDVTPPPVPLPGKKSLRTRAMDDDESDLSSVEPTHKRCIGRCRKSKLVIMFQSKQSV